MMPVVADNWTEWGRFLAAPVEKGKVFIEMVDHPSYIDLLEAIADGELLLAGWATRRSGFWDFRMSADEGRRQGVPLETEPGEEVDEISGRERRRGDHWLTDNGVRQV